MSSIAVWLMLAAVLLVGACGKSSNSADVWTAGQAGSAGAAGTGGAMAGTTPVASSSPGASTACVQDADCDDGIACTMDLCAVAQVAFDPRFVDAPGSGFALCGPRLNCHCVSVPGNCSAGTCDVRTGCSMTATCATDADCADDDPCTVSERCDPASRTCRYDVLDGDDDGFPPLVCGGIDCNDNTESAPAPIDDDCDGIDSDCDGKTDEDVDLQTDRYNCGTCENRCDSGVCTNGECEPCGDVGLPCCVEMYLRTYPCGVCDNFGCMDTGQCVDGTCQPF